MPGCALKKIILHFILKITLGNETKNLTSMLHIRLHFKIMNLQFRECYETSRDVQDGGLLLGRRRCEAARRNGSLRGIGERD